ncbi:UDP-2,3-diacylglucosamine diphosphatase [Lutibacter maritimus]|uniref:UDP-2,3-diacylglucosamine pyrophosphatase LpxH n=1 Tax=Lutibacter maritimus TaxID=593133 RepID=A0A1I6Q5K4_9FLAO|nr:UDP-2,3-diacylglucosamine diphosphatase [Lutibacter maritimus]SFS47761.1 UDP-2,3-diacylglucosamine pyrophosphatase LpxH [Lutibacter maritimus]
MNSQKTKRNIDIVVISDIHLGTYGCHAKELLSYLKSINPQTLILNGDIIDIWQFSKRYWPKSHMKVIKYIFKLISEEKEVYYIPGNHDEMLRKFTDFKLGSFSIKNKVVLELDGKKAWFFHGDVFDVTMQHSKWLAKLGAIGYDSLILINRGVNFISNFFGKGKISLSKKIKDSVKSAVKFINNFEETATNIAIENKFDFVICGHIHQPIIKEIENNKGKVMYLNSGDWIENLTALEYYNKQWNLYSYNDDDLEKNTLETETSIDIIDQTTEEIFGQLLADFNFKI